MDDAQYKAEDEETSGYFSEGLKWSMSVSGMSEDSLSHIGDHLQKEASDTPPIREEEEDDDDMICTTCRAAKLVKTEGTATEDVSEINDTHDGDSFEPDSLLPDNGEDEFMAEASGKESRVAAYLNGNVTESTQSRSPAWEESVDVRFSPVRDSVMELLRLTTEAEKPDEEQLSEVKSIVQESPVTPVLEVKGVAITTESQEKLEELDVPKTRSLEEDAVHVGSGSSSPGDEIKEVESVPDDSDHSSDIIIREEDQNTAAETYEDIAADDTLELDDTEFNSVEIKSMREKLSPELDIDLLEEDGILEQTNSLVILDSPDVEPTQSSISDVPTEVWKKEDRLMDAFEEATTPCDEMSEPVTDEQPLLSTSESAHSIIPDLPSWEPDSLTPVKPEPSRDDESKLKVIGDSSETSSRSSSQKISPTEDLGTSKSVSYELLQAPPETPSELNAEARDLASTPLADVARFSLALAGIFQMMPDDVGEEATDQEAEGDGMADVNLTEEMESELTIMSEVETVKVDKLSPDEVVPELAVNGEETGLDRRSYEADAAFPEEPQETSLDADEDTLVVKEPDFDALETISEDIVVPFEEVDEAPATSSRDVPVSVEQDDDSSAAIPEVAPVLIEREGETLGEIPEDVPVEQDGDATEADAFASEIQEVSSDAPPDEVDASEKTILPHAEETLPVAHNLSEDASPGKPKYYFIDAASLFEEEILLPCTLRVKEDKKSIQEEKVSEEQVETTESTKEPVENLVREHMQVCSECGNPLASKGLDPCAVDAAAAQDTPEVASGDTDTELRRMLQENERRQGNLLFQSSIQQFSQHSISSGDVAPKAEQEEQPDKPSRASKQFPASEKHPGTFAYILNPSIMMETEIDAPKRKTGTEGSPSPADSLNEEDGDKDSGAQKSAVLPDSSTALRNLPKNDPDSTPIVSGGIPSDSVEILKLASGKPARSSQLTPEAWVIDMKKDGQVHDARKHDGMPVVSGALQVVEFKEQPADAENEKAQKKVVESAPLAVGYFLNITEESKKDANQTEKDKGDGQANKSMFSMFIDFSDVISSKPRREGRSQHFRSKSISNPFTSRSWNEEEKKADASEKPRQDQTALVSTKESEKGEGEDKLKPIFMVVDSASQPKPPKPPKEKQAIFMFIEADSSPKRLQHKSLMRPGILSQAWMEDRRAEDGQRHKRAQSFSLSERLERGQPVSSSTASSSSLERLTYGSPLPRRGRGLHFQTLRMVKSEEGQGDGTELLGKSSELSVSQTTLSSDSQLPESSGSRCTPQNTPLMMRKEMKLHTRRGAEMADPSPMCMTPRKSALMGRSGGEPAAEEVDATLSEASEMSSMQSSMERSGAEATTTETDSSSCKGRGPCSRLGEDLLRMFLEEINTDIVVEVSGHKIKAHKCILSSRCQYFAAMLSGGWVESAGNIISLQGFSYNAVHFALCHIYSGASDIPNTINIVELATLADMLGLEGLKEVISYTLKVKYCHFFHKPCSICVVGVLECLPLAAAYGLDEIYRKSLRWVTRYFTRIWPTKAFASLPCELIEKCYQQNVLHLSADNVMDTVLSCDKLLATLPSVRWAEPVFGITTRLLEASIKFMAKNFSTLLTSEKFLALGRGLSWNISQLEDTILTAVGCMSPNEACQSHIALCRLLRNVKKEESEAEWSPTFLDFLKKIEQHIECYLLKNANRVVQCQNWDALEEEMQRKLTETVFLLLKNEKPNQPRLMSLNKKPLASSGYSSSGSSVNLAQNQPQPTSPSSIYCTLPRSSRLIPTSAGKSSTKKGHLIDQIGEESTPDSCASPLVKRAAAVLRAQKGPLGRTGKGTERPASVPAKVMASGRTGHQRTGSTGSIGGTVAEKADRLFSPRRVVKEKVDSPSDLTKSSPMKRTRGDKTSLMATKPTSTSSSCISTPSVISRPAESSAAKHDKDMTPKQTKAQSLALLAGKAPRSPLAASASRIPTSKKKESPHGTPLHLPKSARSIPPPRWKGVGKSSSARDVSGGGQRETRPRTASLSQTRGSAAASESSHTPTKQRTALAKAEAKPTEKAKVLSSSPATASNRPARIQVVEKFQRPLSPKVTTDTKTTSSPAKKPPVPAGGKSGKPVAVVAPKSTRSFRDMTQGKTQGSPRATPRPTRANQSAAEPKASPKPEVKFLAESSRSGTFLKDEPTVIKKPEDNEQELP